MSILAYRNLSFIDRFRSICVFGKLPRNRLLGHSHEHLDANQLLNGWQTGSTLPNFRRRVMPERPHCINTGMRHTRDLTDEQWKTLDPLIPKPMKREDGRGRPWKSRRSVLNGVLWVLRTGAPWADLPDRYPSFQTCHRRFQQWVRFGVMTRS